MNRTPLAIVALFLFVSLLNACTTDSGFTIPEPTFDIVPEPFDISNAEEEPVVDGITKYVVEEGRGQDQVVIRDDIAIWMTLRTTDDSYDEPIYSTYQDGNTSSIPFTLQDIVTNRTATPVRNFNRVRSYTEGLRKGLIGMKEGEKRVLIVPPEEGFQGIPGSSINDQFRDDTLRYDIEVDFIF